MGQARGLNGKSRRDYTEKQSLFASPETQAMVQLTGSQFTETTTIVGNDIATFPDFPAELERLRDPRRCIRFSLISRRKISTRRGCAGCFGGDEPGSPQG